ncbi:Ltp family lipoprotein, partial [Staphylococcus haemolyticus]
MIDKETIYNQLTSSYGEKFT